MRNVPFTSNVGGSELIGIVKNGKKFPFGTVSEETYNADLADITERIQNVGEVAEHAVNSVGEVQTTVDTLGVRVTTAEQTIANHGQRIGTLETSVSGIEARVTAAENNITAVTSTANSTQSGLATLNTRVAADYAELRTRIVAVSEAVESVNTVASGIEADVEDLSERIAVLNRRVDDITGDDTVEITSFTATPNVCELGGVENVVLTWTTEGNVASAKINDAPVTGNTYTATVTTDTRFTLEVAPAHGAAVSKSIDISFVNHIFWGVNASAAMDEGVVKALGNTELTDERTRMFMVSADNQYIYYAYPERLGTSVFLADGFEGGFTAPASILIDNHSGISENYYVYRSENKISGITNVEVR